MDKHCLRAGDPSKKNQTSVFSLIHLLTCITCAMLTAYYLLLFVATIMDTLQDMDKYGGLGFTHTYSFYSKENHCFEYMCLFLSAAAELLLYWILSRRTKDNNPNRGSLLYFFIMLIAHVVFWLYTKTIQLPEHSVLNVFDETLYIYCYYANTTILPSIMYFVLFLFRMQRKTE